MMRLTEITLENVGDACKLSVRPEQEGYVAPVAWSLAAAYCTPNTAWPRLVFDGDEPVAFIMGNFDPDAEDEGHRCGIWRLNVAADRQGNGYGRFAVEQLIAEARRRGQHRVTVSWVPGEHSPEQFYLKLGFTPTGVVKHGEIEGELFL
jgi:diamine N-acetyltransferase